VSLNDVARSQHAYGGKAAPTTTMVLSALNLRFWEQNAANMIESTDVAPLVVVEGFLSWTAGSALLWGKFETYLNAHREKFKLFSRREPYVLDYFFLISFRLQRRTRKFVT
jgi:hypothetical protein